MRDLQTIWHDDFKPFNIEIVGFSRCERFIMASLDGIDRVYKQDGNDLILIYYFSTTQLRSQNIKIFINNKNWEETPELISPQIDIEAMNKFSDEIDECKERGAIGDLSQVAYNLLTELLKKDSELRPLRDKETDVNPASPDDLISSNRDYNDYFEREPKNKKEWQEFSEELIKLLIEKDQSIIKLFNKVNHV